MNMTNAPSEPIYAERIAQGIELLQGKWTVYVLCVLCKRPVRLGELRRVRKRPVFPSRQPVRDSPR
jgi:DNA-binding HxlR family transcriptional regulator